MPVVLFFKATLRDKPGLVPRRLIDRRGRATSRWVREHAEADPRPPTSTAGNIARGRAAMAHVITHHDDAPSAMFRSGLGWIDFVWGSEGKPPSKSGKRKGAQGVAHILEARQRKDGMTDAQARQLAMFLPEVIARGWVVRADAFGDKRRIIVEYGGYEAALVKPSGAHAWVLSGWRKTPVR